MKLIIISVKLGHAGDKRDKSNGQFLCLLIALVYEKAFRDPGSGLFI